MLEAIQRLFMSIINVALPKTTINNTINLFSKTAFSILDSNRNSFRVLFDIIASVYFSWQIYIYILSLEMASQVTSTVPVVSAHFRSLYTGRQWRHFVPSGGFRNYQLGAEPGDPAAGSTGRAWRSSRDDRQITDVTHFTLRWDSGARFTNISYDLSKDYRKFIVWSTYDSDLESAKISFRHIVS